MRRSEKGKAEQELPLGYVAHTSASRTRLSFPDLKGRDEQLRSLCAGLRKLADVNSVEGRPLTGSVIVAHHGGIEDLVNAARQAGVFDVGELAQESGLLVEAAAWKDWADQSLRDVLGPGANLRTIAAFAFIAMALRQIAGGSIMPPAATALWYGLSLLLAANPEPSVPPEDGGE